MSEYTPDGWQCVIINNELIKVFGCWYGGYGGSDVWRLNSGTERFEEDASAFYAHGSSGSVYTLHKGLEGKLSSYGKRVLAQLKANVPEEYTMEDISVEDAIKFLDKKR